MKMFQHLFYKEGVFKMPSLPHTPQSQQRFYLFLIVFPITDIILQNILYPVMLIKDFTVPLAMKKQHHVI